MKPLYIRDLKDGRHIVHCPWENEHTTESSRTSTVIFDGSNGRLGFDCKHKHCEHRTLSDVIRFYQEKGVVPNRFFPKLDSSVLNNENQTGLDVVSYADFMKKYENLKPSWVVDGLCLENGISILAAKPKVGKSTITRSLIKAVINGEPFLGRKTKKGKVLLISLEEPPMVMVDHFRRLNLDPKSDIIIAIHNNSKKEFPKELRKIMMREKPILVIIDTLQKVTSFQEINRYDTTYEAIEPLVQIARDFPSHIIVAHHQNKKEGGGQDSILGSTGIAASFDNLIFIEIKDGKRLISTQPRFGDEIPKTFIDFDKSTGTFSFGKEVSVANEENLSQQILDFFEQQGSREIEHKELKDTFRGRSQNLTNALKSLVSKKVLSQSKSGNKKAYKLIDIPDWI